MQTLKRVKMATARAGVARLFTVLGEGQRRLDDGRVEPAMFLLVEAKA